MPPRRLILLRHGQTQANRDGIWQGHLDVALTEAGHAQAAAAAAALTAYAPVRLVSSDLQRAARTAQAVAERVGRPVELDPRWREFDVGQWTGLTNAEVIARHPQERLALADLISALQAGQSAIIVTHGGTIRVLLATLLGIDVQTTRLLTTPGNCQWAELVQADTGWRVAGWNLRAADSR